MLYLSLFIAGLIIIITPGPVFVASLSLIAEKGRMQGLKLVSGALLGDSVWLFLTFLFFIESSRMPEWFFPFLAISCALYIFCLAYKLFKHAQKPQENMVFEKPFKDGLMVGVLNPKTYPVNIAIFSALVFDYLDDMTWQDFPLIFGVATLGFLAGYLLINLVAGFSGIKTFYKRNLKNFSYIFAAVFVYFGISLTMEALK